MVEALELAEKVFNRKTGIANALNKVKKYPDEPNLPHFVSVTCDLSPFTDGLAYATNGSGASFDETKAKTKALCEAIERYSQCIYKENEFTKTSYEKIKRKALNPKAIVSFSEKQLKELKGGKFLVGFDEKTVFKWVNGFNLSSNKPTLIPAQLVYYNYKLKEEPAINIPLSTGAALGCSFEETVCKGIYEIVERDAFMISYLNMLPRERVNLEKIENEEIQKFVQIFKDYELMMNVYDITTDMLIYSFVCLILDNKLNFLSVGLKSSLNPIDGILGAIEEAYQTRSVGRRDMETVEKSRIEWLREHSEEISSFFDRCVFWFGKEMMEKLDFWLKSKKEKDGNKLKNLSSGDWKKDLKFLLKVFSEKKMDVLYVDVTTHDVKELGFYVLKVIIPGMQPLHLKEKYKYLGGKRLYEVPYLLGYKKRIVREEELNQLPHPFL